MKKALLLSTAVLLLCSCGGKKQLYSWGDYEKTSYNYLKNADEESTEKLVADFQEIINKQKGTRNMVPPGICADYGYLLIQQGKVNEGKEMLKKEIALYPESKVFIDRIIKMTEK